MTRMNQLLKVIMLSMSVDACAGDTEYQILEPSITQMTAQFSPDAYKKQQVHAAVKVLAYGEGAQRVYVFLPEQPPLNDKTKVPVVFFHHGWQGMNPKNFGAMIDHLARSGHVVVYPVYQESSATSPQVVTTNAVAANLSALKLFAENGLEIDTNRVLYVGYSMGAAISLNIAIQPDHWGLPAPKALVLIAPGDAHHVATGMEAKSIIGDVQKLPPSLPMVLITGAADTTIGVPTARKIMSQLCGVNSDQRVLMLLPSDQYGEATVRSAHGSPGAPDSRYDFALSDSQFPRIIRGRAGFEASSSLNQLDFYGFWKVLCLVDQGVASDSLSSSIVFAKGTTEQLFLGVWPNGAPFKPIQLENPCQP